MRLREFFRRRHHRPGGAGGGSGVGGGGTGGGAGGSGAGGGEPADRCELCGADVAGGPVCGLIADAAVIRPAEPSLNGLRLLTACSRAHLLELTSRYEGDGLAGPRPPVDLAANRR